MSAPKCSRSRGALSVPRQNSFAFTFGVRLFAAFGFRCRVGGSFSLKQRTISGWRYCYKTRHTTALGSSFVGPQRLPELRRSAPTQRPLRAIRWPECIGRLKHSWTSPHRGRRHCSQTRSDVSLRQKVSRVRAWDLVNSSMTAPVFNRRATSARYCSPDSRGNNAIQPNRKS
jgi:hypothetical protein